MSREFIVVTPQVAGNPEIGYGTHYYSDMRRCETLNEAVRHGAVELDRADDFLIGNVDGNRLVALQWMNESRDDDHERRVVAAQLGLSA